MRNVAMHPTVGADLEPEFRLFAAVVRRAIGDVEGAGPWAWGEDRIATAEEAEAFLSWVCPQWRRFV